MQGKGLGRPARYCKWNTNQVQMCEMQSHDFSWKMLGMQRENVGEDAGYNRKRFKETGRAFSMRRVQQDYRYIA
jgi:hypothetical protein